MRIWLFGIVLYVASVTHGRNGQSQLCRLPPIQLRAAVYFTREHVLCASFLHSFVTMAAISCAPTVRATAAPKVAIRRTNVRAAATGIRTQFGAVKGFAPVG